MSVRANRHRLRFLLGVGLVAFSGCGFLQPHKTPPTNFYVLDATVPRSELTPGRSISLGLGPLSMPPYLERPEMVSRVAPNQIDVDEFNRWAEPFKINFLRALAVDLDALIGLRRLASYPWYANTPLDYSVAIAVLRCEPQPDGTVLLDARWTVGDGRGAIFDNHESTFTRPAGSPAENAAAISALVGDLARAIAAKLRELDAGRTH